MTTHQDVPPHPTRDSAETRARLVRAALELFTTLGYRATTTALVAARAGIAEGTIYRHFGGKEELFAEVRRAAQRWGAELVRGTADVAERPVPARERLQRVGRRLLEAADREPALVRMALGQRHEPPLDERGKDAAREFREALQQVMASGKSDGVIRAGPAELWSAVWLEVAGYAVEKVASREWPADHPSIGPVLEAAWDAIAPRSNP
ncbi:MAG TPA: TetR/AcrR family transcriptional regulator [Gemmatimonadales bacterium]|nr:TetR/AcrR family transcriptional regulator [Gemmatimonadales bacterium]